MKKIIFNKLELQCIEKYGELCLASALEAIDRSDINFDDIERINEHYENHRWGSNADRKYRKAAINKAILKVASNPKKFSAQFDNTQF